MRLSERENAAFSLPETAASACVCRSLLPPLPTIFRLSFLFSITECSEWYVSGRLFFNKHYSNTVLNRKTDFPAFARSFGADGETVTTPEELDAALTRAFAAEGPYIVDCRIDKDEFVLPMLPPGGSMDDIIVKAEVEK